MSYEVLARRRRPAKLDEVVGQGHVLRPLRHALETRRMPQAILLSGMRGVGKTSLGRILARCLNCEKGPTADPCGECSPCKEILENRHMDLLELDAASNTQVEKIRELLESTIYQPAQGRYRLYLMDEAHMLSNHSFNALLKTLEEPPEHVFFLLATTEPDKLPRTVVSRCLQFHLRALGMDTLREVLTGALQEDGVECDQASLDLLARAAGGSARDALTLCEQAVAHGGGKLQESQVAEMLGMLDPQVMEALLGAIVRADGPALSELLRQISARDLNCEEALDALLRLLHRISVRQQLGEHAGEGSETEVRLAGEVPPEQVQLLYQVALHGRSDLPLAPDPMVGFEMTVLRMMAFVPASMVEGGERRRWGQTRALRQPPPPPPLNPKPRPRKPRRPRLPDLRHSLHSRPSHRRRPLLKRPKMPNVPNGAAPGAPHANGTAPAAEGMQTARQRQRQGAAAGALAGPRPSSGKGVSGPGQGGRFPQGLSPGAGAARDPAPAR